MIICLLPHAYDTKQEPGYLDNSLLMLCFCVALREESMHVEFAVSGYDGVLLFTQALSLFASHTKRHVSMQIITAELVYRKN